MFLVSWRLKISERSKVGAEGTQAPIYERRRRYSLGS